MGTLCGLTCEAFSEKEAPYFREGINESSFGYYRLLVGILDHDALVLVMSSLLCED